MIDVYYSEPVDHVVGSRPLVAQRQDHIKSPHVSLFDGKFRLYAFVSDGTEDQAVTAAKTEAIAEGFTVNWTSFDARPSQSAEEQKRQQSLESRTYRQIP